MSSKLKLLSTKPALVDLSLLLIRILAGGFILSHGLGKLQKLINGDFTFADPLGIGPEASLILTVFAEIICAFFIVLGLFTRFMAVPLIITMLVIIFIVHKTDDFGHKELAYFYLINYIVVFLSGAGKYSMDKLLLKK
ncbi:DoxX family protein [Chishuiella sp.]|uniref:DoxX family protein n=1 Tax=Chishuiella sp. TaxID=1969467 RepID=UPI0028B0A9EA|nr:DoxX family protein [Chishuiella sp.]